MADDDLPLLHFRVLWVIVNECQAVGEDGHVSDVKAGENHGVTLRHDHVVRLDGRIAPFAGALVRRIDAPSRGEGGRVPRVIAVLTDAVSGATVQAVELRCAG